jgi:hypothetical protein
MNFIHLHILTCVHCMYCIWSSCLLLRMWNFILHNSNEQVKSWLIRHRERSPNSYRRRCTICTIVLYLFYFNNDNVFCFSLTCPCTNDIRHVFLFDLHVKFMLGSLFMWVWLFYTIKLTPLRLALTRLAPREQRPTVWHLYVFLTIFALFALFQFWL